ncbi:MAG: tetratricopeptide repeat protein [Bryobacterales bacterium]|nr:tetratricopeptide repeat protein [Bryobacterales bacterium]
MKTTLISTIVLVLGWINVLAGESSRGIELYQANQFGEAESVLREEVGAEPENAKAWQSLGMTLLRLGKLDEAKDALRKAADLDPADAEAKLGLAEAAAHEKNFDEANGLVEEAVTLNAESPKVPYVRGVIKAGQRDFKGAVKDLEEACEKDERNAYAHYYAGLSYNALKRPDKMIGHFQSFTKLAGKAPEAQRVQTILKTAR